MNDWISLGVAIVILVVASAIFIRISRKARRGGSGATVTGFGALYDLHNRDKRRAIETIVEVNAGKKLEEQKSGEGDGLD
jgi:hypothetical protein